MTEAKTIQIYDTTLRDGCQARGVSLFATDKLRIAQRLDDMGFAYVEGGWPNPTNPKDLEFFDKAARINFKHAKLAAFGSTRRGENQADKDSILRTLLKAETPVVTIFGKSWHMHVQKVLRVSLDENLRMIQDSCRFLKSAQREVIYDAEHFFDGFRENPTYALKTLQAAQEGGADCVVLCETNGGRLYFEVEEALEAAKTVLKVPFGIHTHNDAGMGVANSITGVCHGACQVQGTVNGYGERCGNANLCTIIPILELKMGYQCLLPRALAKLTDLSRFVDELANMAHDERQPFVGTAAFTHKAGMHIDGVVKERRSFEHVPPEAVGNVRELAISDQAGTRAIVERLREEFPDLEKADPRVAQILQKLKDMEHQGYQFEAADASFKLLARRALNQYQRFFDLEGFRVIVEKHNHESPCHSEATIKVRVDGRECHTAAEGDGPVDALDRALRKALDEFYPELRNILLTDYKVRVLNQGSGTSAKVRVLIDSTDHEDAWSTVGVSENVIEASWQALLDSIEYGLAKRILHGRDNPKAVAERESVSTDYRPKTTD